MLLQYYKFRYNIPRASRQSQTLSEDCGKLGRRSSQNLPLSKAIDFSSSRFTADFATVHRKDILPYDLRFFSPSGTTEPCQNVELLKSGIFLQIYGAEPGFSPDVVPCFLLWNKGSTWEITEAPAYLNTSPYRPLFCIIEASQTRNWTLLKATDLLFIMSSKTSTSFSTAIFIDLLALKQNIRLANWLKMLAIFYNSHINQIK